MTWPCFPTGSSGAAMLETSPWQSVSCLHKGRQRVKATATAINELQLCCGKFAACKHKRLQQTKAASPAHSSSTQSIRQNSASAAISLDEHCCCENFFPNFESLPAVAQWDLQSRKMAFPQHMHLSRVKNYEERLTHASRESFLLFAKGANSKKDLSDLCGKLSA